MAIKNVLLDTNAYAAFKDNGKDALDIIRHCPKIGINSIVIGELRAGFAIGIREETNIEELQDFLTSHRIHILPIDHNTATYYAQVYQNLRRRGKPIPTNDMWIAATALQHAFAVFSYDKHFKDIDGLTAGKTLYDFLDVI